jgi:hypothetical protein
MFGGGLGLEVVMTAPVPFRDEVGYPQRRADGQLHALLVLKMSGVVGVKEYHADRLLGIHSL